MKRPTPPYRSLIENPKWSKVKCERCEVDFWLEPCKVGAIRYCTKECRYLPPEKVIENRTVMPDGPDGCWICTLTPSSPYPQIKTGGNFFRVNRFLLEKSLGRPIGEGLLALHKCNNSRCVRVGELHIYEGTQEENIRWCIECGRGGHARGEDHKSSKFSEEQALAIRACNHWREAGDLAVKFGFSHDGGKNIWYGYNWKHLDNLDVDNKNGE